MESHPAPPARGDYFAADDYFGTDVAAGVARDRAGTRVVSLPEELLDGLHETLAAECGPAAERVLKSCGRAWGRRLAERLAHELGEYHNEPLAAAPVARFQAALHGAFCVLGWGVLALDFGRYDKGLLVAEVRNAPPAGPLMAGALAGLFSHFAGRELDAAATPAADGEPRRFVIALPGRLERVADAIHTGRTHDEIVAELEDVRG
jgi:hypothetical protein